MAWFKKKTTRDESYYMASQWTLMWRKLQRHKLAKFSIILLAILYLGALFADFIGFLMASVTVRLFYGK